MQKYLDDLESIKSIKKKIDDFEPQSESAEFEQAQWEICIELLKHIDETEREEMNKNSVLIFAPGFYEINRVYNAIRKYVEHEPAVKYSVMRVHSILPRDKMDIWELMQEPPPGTRKVIISTNICESSITIPDVVHVIDFCLTKFQNKCERTNLVSLTLGWASQESCDQRKGRAGRTRAGTCYRLLPKQFFMHNLNRNTQPEISFGQLEKAVLLGKTVFPNLAPMKFFEMACEVPKEKDVILAVKSLKHSGAMSVKVEHDTLDDIGKVGSTDKSQLLTLDDLKDGKLTHLGKLMNLLPMDFAQTRLIYFGYVFGFLEEAVIMACGVQQGGFWAEDSGPHR